MKYDDEKENLDLDIKNSNEAIINLLQEVEILLQKIEEVTILQNKNTDLIDEIFISLYKELLREIIKIKEHQIKQEEYFKTIFQELSTIKNQINQKDNQ